MTTKKLFLLGIILGVTTILTWVGLLYFKYGKQTLLYLLRSSPEQVWTYSKAAINTPDDGAAGKPGSLDLTELERPKASLAPAPAKYMISGMSHAYQKLNNCGPVTASMTASVFGVNFDQFFAAEHLKGGPSDKNVGPLEMKKFLESQGLRVAYRLNGNPEIIEQLVSRGIPVMVEQWLVKRENNELVGHYRVVKGYDRQAKLFTTNDSFNGPNFVIPYAQFDEWWRPFNRSYLVAYKSEQENMIKEVLRSDWEEKLNWEDTAKVAQAEIESVGDGYSYFNLGSAYTKLHEFEKAASAYDESFKKTFPPHFLWYEFGPLFAYYEVGRYDRVFAISDQVLREAGSVEEAHYYRGLSYLKQGKTEEAKAEQEKTLSANPNFIPPFE
jgi:hypothetical protein